MSKKKYIKSPLNYTGGKYKLLDKIVPLFPKNIKTFIDLFAGGCNVGVNIDAHKIIANDIKREIIELYNFFMNKTSDEVLNLIDETIKRYNLSNTAKNGYEFYGSNSFSGVANYNKINYLKLREEYNKNKNPLEFYVLIIYAFNNQIRFNSKGEFNLPVNKRDFSKNMRNNLISFIEKIQTIDIEFISKDFREVSVNNNSFIYIDPPYLASIASYNENGGWSETKERELLDFIDSLNSNNIKFALSNVFENKNKKNELLIKWSKKYNINYIEHSYSNCNYQAKNKSKKATTEVLITNY